MFGQLEPDPQRFRAAYPKWIEQTAELIAGTAEGTTFGIFGTWGSGKTSATKALQEAVELAMRAPLQPENSIGIAYVDCSALNSKTPSEIEKSVRGKLVRGNIIQRDLQLERLTFTFFRKAGRIIGKMPDPWSKATGTSIEVLSEIGQEIEDERQRERRPEAALSIQRAFIFLDDLDRCDADVAWAVLRHARLGLPTAKTISVIVCDPVVLGHHISHVLGVPLAHGFQAVLKYIDVPLKIPSAYTESHYQAIKERIAGFVSEEWQLEAVACDAIPSIPMRDILAALPQTCLWLSSWDSSDISTSKDMTRTLKRIAEVIFYLALIHICIPNAAQLMSSGKKDKGGFHLTFRQIAQGLTNPMQNSTQSAIENQFGAIVQEVIAGRMDLIRYGRERQVGEDLDNVDVGSRKNVWEKIWETLVS